MYSLVISSSRPLGVGTGYGMLRRICVPEVSVGAVLCVHLPLVLIGKVSGLVVSDNTTSVIEEGVGKS